MAGVIIGVYICGMALTAFGVLRNRVFNRDYLVNVLAILFWPIYWTFFLTTRFLNRA